MEASTTNRIPLEALKNVKFQSKVRGELTPQLKAKAITLWPWIIECSESQKESNPTPEVWANGFCHDTTPECEIFFWECVVLSFIHTLELLSNEEGNGDAIDTEKWRTLPVPPVRALQSESNLNVIKQIDMKFREIVYVEVFQHMNDMESRGEPGGILPLHLAAAKVAVVKVRAVRNNEYETLQKLKEIRYGLKLGAACAGCGVVGTKHKKCARCETTYYCGTDCQRSHWKVHKKTCKPQDREFETESK